MSGFQSPNHTQVPNDFFDMMPEMSEAELRVTLIMIRETRGWHRDAAKIGKQEMADRSGLSFNGVTAGCEGAEQRGTFRRTNPNTKTKAEWELVESDTPSTSEGVNPQPVRESPSTSEGQVRVKENINKKEKKNKAATPRAEPPQQVKLYREVTKKYPPSPNYDDVISKIDLIQKRLGRAVVEDDLRPFYKAWTGNGWNQFSINWLDYAVKNEMPTAYKKNDKPVMPKAFSAIQNWQALKGTSNGD